MITTTIPTTVTISISVTTPILLVEKELKIAIADEKKKEKDMQDLAIAFKNVINTDEIMVSVNQTLRENLIKAQEEVDKYEDKLKKAIEDKKIQDIYLKKISDKYLSAVVLWFDANNYLESLCSEIPEYIVKQNAISQKENALNHMVKFLDIFDKANMKARRAESTMLYRKNDLFMARRTLIETKNVNHIPFFDAYTASIESFVSAEKHRKSLEQKLVTLRTTTSDTSDTSDTLDDDDLF